MKIINEVEANFLDDKGETIVKITSKTRGSWDNNLLWWTSSRHKDGKTTPADTLRATMIQIDAKGCKSESVPVKLTRTYEPMSVFPHGGGAAHFIYRFDKSVTLQCD